MRKKKTGSGWFDLNVITFFLCFKKENYAESFLFSLSTKTQNSQVAFQKTLVWLAAASSGLELHKTSTVWGHRHNPALKSFMSSLMK